MKRRWSVTMLCITVLSFAHIAIAAIPRFPSEDDFAMVLGAKSKPSRQDDIFEEPAEPLQITHLRIRSEIALRYARTSIVSKVHNPSKRPQLATFQVIIPETAFISGFSMTIGNETYDAYVKPKEEAKKIFNEAVAKGDSAAQVSTEARDSNHYLVEFNLEGNSDGTYFLTYEELLVRRNHVYNYAINILPGGLVPNMDVIVRIKESQKISKLRIPELRTGHEVDATEKDAQYSKAVVKKSRNGRGATITFTPDLEEQRRLAEIYAEKAKKIKDPYSPHIGFDSDEEEEETENGVLGQFVVQYDLEQPKDGEVLVNDGYFMHLLAPSSLPPLNKYVVFVLDTSGSMAGNKIVQLHKAMNAILSDLHPNDYFNIVEFNSAITIHDMADAYKPARPTTPYYDYSPSTAPIIPVPPSKASPINIDAAKIIISRLVANGGTNINTALQEALKLAQKGVYHKNQLSSVNNANDETIDLEPIIIFLTDGEPTVGITNTEHIIAYITEKNSEQKRVPVFSLALGDNADRVFLRRLSLQNEGFMRHIYEASDAALQLHDFYRQVSSPVLSNVTFLYPSQQIKEKSITRTHFHTINDGTEVAVVGKIADGINEITPKILGLRSDDEGKGRKNYEASPKVPVPREKDEYLPLERIWAYLTIKQLLDKRDAADETSNSESKPEDDPEQKAMAIALQYDFVTPVTSLVVVRLNKIDDIDRLDVNRVDEPGYLRKKKAVNRDALATREALEGQSTGGELTVNTSDGPLLYAQSTRRLSNDGLRRRDQSSTAPPTTQSGKKLFGRGHTEQWGNDPFAKMVKYHLRYMQWTSTLINEDDDTLVFKDNGVDVILKLAKYETYPPQSHAGDGPCGNRTVLTAADSPISTDSNVTESTAGACVYITRCNTAQYINLDGYRKSYCIVDANGVMGLAGVCCLRTEIESL